MFQKMLQVSNGGGDSGTPKYEKHNLEVHGNRCTLKDGGYYVKDGYAFVDVTFTATATTTDAQPAVKGFPVPKYSSKTAGATIYNVTSGAYHGVKNFSWSSDFSVVMLNSSMASGSTYRAVASYLTDDANT